MTTTGTLAPLLNKRDYTEDEKTVLLHFFTNTDKNIYCATNNMSYQLRAFLMGQYSRTSLSMRDRFLQLFTDCEKALEKGIITEEEYVTLEDLAESIRAGGNKNLQYFEDKASNFLKKWGVDYGHNSLKDADRVRFAIEGVSQVFTKVIESPFPALGDFQEKSTRYVDFGGDSLTIPEDVENSKYSEEIKAYQKDLMKTYMDSKGFVREQLIKNNVVNREDFSNDRVYNNTLDAKVFDICRYILPSNITTSLGAAFSTRTLETHLSYMLSHANSEVRLIAKSMHEEALKISPGLLKHVGVSDYKIERKEKLDKFVGEMLKHTSPIDKAGYYQGINDEERVKIIFEGDLDAHILASIIFESGKIEGISYDEALDIVENMENSEKEHLMELALGCRGKFDRMPRALQHSTIMVEFLVDFGAYRDIQRHRATKQLWQGSTSIHGYDYPEYIDLPGMEEFKENYDRVMTAGVELGRKVIKDNDVAAEYCSGLGHLIRTTFEMDPGQIAYVIELRTTPQGHDSYRRLFLELYKQFSELSPIFAKYIRAGIDLEATRRTQEERAEVKRKALGI